MSCEARGLNAAILELLIDNSLERKKINKNNANIALVVRRMN